ncbi:MAG: phytanoyl-CoA dioxygenase family protein [Deltaproteobacteria bacterium]|nr:phytanoyl-CoA dioxygenase family protein [Deltaproteobacteria bacterium]
MSPPAPPLGATFRLGAEITPEQRAYLHAHGYLHFKGVLTPEEVELVKRTQDELQAALLAEGVREIKGVPLFFGPGLSGEPAIYRIPFSSERAPALRALLDDARFEPLKGLVGDGARVGHSEQDGVVLNRYVNTPSSARPGLGWHTDGLRDIFYLRMPQQMLNFGLHFDHITPADGGLRLLPGTHTQGFLSTLLRKPYFIYHRPDPKELCVETEPGDMTVHDGRLWHRVAQSTRLNAERRSLFVPYTTGAPIVRTAQSKTVLYHRLGRLLRRLKGGG